MAESFSPEYHTLIKCTNDLVLALRADPVWIADKLLSCGLISADVYGRLQMPAQDDDTKARLLITCVRDQVKLDGQKYHRFLSVLSGEMWLEMVVKKLSTTYDECCQNSSTALGKRATITSDGTMSVEGDQPAKRFYDGTGRSLAMAESSPEYDTLIKCTTDLILALRADPVVIADKLLSCGLISADVYGRLQMPAQDGDTKARLLITCVRDQVKLDGQKYHRFLSVLSGEMWLEMVVKKLSTTYDECCQSSSTALHKTATITSDVTAPVVVPGSTQQCATIEDQIDSFKKRFRDIVFMTIYHLSEIEEKRPNYVKILRRYITSLPNDERKRCLLTSTTLSRLKKSQTVEDLFIILGDHWDYMNYLLLKLIVEQFGSPSLKYKMREYVRDFEIFSSTAKITDYPAWVKNIPSDFSEVVVKLHIRPEDCTLQHLLEYRSNIGQSTYLKPYVIGSGGALDFGLSIRNIESVRADAVNSEKDRQVEEILQVDRSKPLFEEAMQSGHVLCHIITLLLIGVAGAGKTSFLQLVLNLPPPAVRESTPLAQCAIRAISVSRASFSESGTIWHAVSPAMLLSWLADAIKGGLTIQFLQPLPPSPSLPMPTTQVTTQSEVARPSPPQAMFTSSQPTTNEPDSRKGSSLSTRDASSYEKLIERGVVQEFLDMIKRSEGPGKKFDDHWVYLVDTGGQPQFHELLPTFIQHVSGAAIFVKLNESLSSQPEIAYFAEGGHLSGVPYKSSLTHMQTIQNCLQVMQSRHTLSGKVECPRLFFIGTHRDLEHSCEESRESKDEQLLEMLLSHEGLKDNLSFYHISRPEELMYVVNAKDPDAKDREVVGEFRHAVMTQCKHIEIKIPLRWFILERLLQQLSHEKGSCVLSLTECQQVADDFDMDEKDLRAVLDFLVQVNVFKFFPEILPDVVFTTAQVLLDKVSELVEYSHRLLGQSDSKPSKARYDSESLQFRDYGTVSTEFLQRFPKHYITGLFTPQELLKILVDQLVFGHKDDNSYFMPCVLPELSTEDLPKQRIDPEKSLVSALLIHTPGGLFPCGNFSSLIAYLQNRSPWKVAETNHLPTCLFKNCIKFRHLELPVTITLIYSFDYIEVHARAPTDLYSEVCPQILSTILAGLTEAAKVQGGEHLCHELAFFCSCKNNKALHMATINSSKQWCSCSKNDDPDCCNKVTEKQLVWLGCNSKSSTCKEPHSTSERLALTLTTLSILKWRDGEGKRQKLSIVSHVKKSWKKMGHFLGISDSDLESFATKYRDDPEECCRCVFSHWLDNGSATGDYPVTWDGLIELLDDCQFHNFVSKVQEAIKYSSK